MLIICNKGVNYICLCHFSKGDNLNDFLVTSMDEVVLTRVLHLLERLFS